MRIASGAGSHDLDGADGAALWATSSGFLNSVMDATEIEVTGPDTGRVALAAGYANHGEPVHLVRDETGVPIEYWAQGVRYAPESVIAREMRDLYGPPVGP